MHIMCVRSATKYRVWPEGLCIRDGVQAICVQLSLKSRLFPLALQATQMCIKHSDCSSLDKSANGNSKNIQKVVVVVVVVQA